MEMETLKLSAIRNGNKAYFDQSANHEAGAGKY